MGAFEFNAQPGCPVTGDYNGNGIVDAADYTVWRDLLGSSTQLPNEDPNTTPGVVTSEDYDVWVRHLGESCTAGGGQVDEAPAAAGPSDEASLLVAAPGVSVEVAGLPEEPAPLAVAQRRSVSFLPPIVSSQRNDGGVHHAKAGNVRDAEQSLPVSRNIRCSWPSQAQTPMAREAPLLGATRTFKV